MKTSRSIAASYVYYIVDSPEKNKGPTTTMCDVLQVPFPTIFELGLQNVFFFFFLLLQTLVNLHSADYLVRKFYSFPRMANL